MKWPPALLVFSSTTCLLTAGCVASISDTPSSKSPVLHLEFARDGQELRLASGSSANPKTAYPNPTQLDRLHCTVLGNGSIKQTCERGGEKVSCIDPPIFTTIKDDKVVVVDLHGTQLGEIPFEHNSSKPPAENTVNPPNPDSDEAPPPGETKSCQSSEFSTCPDAGNTDKPSEAGSCPSVAAVKASYCAQVNGNLKKAGSSYVLDCSRLKDSFDILKDFESICSSELTLESELPRITRSCDSLTHQQYNEDIDQTEMWETQYSSCEEGHAGDLVEKLIDWDTQARQILRCVGLCLSSPLVLDLDGNGIETTSLNEGVVFAMAGRAPVKTAWIKGNDAWLALDRNQNSEIDGTSELFGELTAGRPHANGFAALAELDTNRDGKIDGKDAIFSQLRLWTDRNMDGKSSPQELSTLVKSGVVRLDLSVQKIPADQAADAHGNSIPLKSTFVRADGSRGALVDLYVQTRPLDVMSLR